MVPLAGELIMEKETTDKLVKAVEKELQAYAKSVLEEFQKRLIQPPLQAAASSLFSNDPEDHSIRDPEEAEPELWSREKKGRYKKLENLLLLLPDRQSQKFSPALIFGGLESFLLFSKQQRVPRRTRSTKTGTRSTLSATTPSSRASSSPSSSRTCRSGPHPR